MYLRKILNSRRQINKFIWLKILILSCIVIPIKPIVAQEESSPLIVSTRHFPPFVFEEENGEYTGFSIDLWDAIASEVGIEYQLYSEENVTGLINSVVEEKADISVAGISMTSEREEIIDFSHPFFESGLKILVRGEQLSPLRLIFRYIFIPGIWITIGILSVVTIIAAHVIWLLERQENDEMFPKSYWRGIWESFWWSVVTLVTVGYGDKTPKTVGGRIIATIWMFSGILLISYFTASVSSALTVQRLDSHIAGYQDLRGKSIATIAGSTSVDFLSNLSVNVVTFHSLDDAHRALENERVEAIVYDSPVLLNYINENPEYNLKTVGNLFDPQSYAIVLPLGSENRNTINRALLTLQEEGVYDEIYQKWFGDNF